MTRARIRIMWALTIWCVVVNIPAIVYGLSVMDARTRKVALWMGAAMLAGQIHLWWITERWHARRNGGTNAKG